MTQQQLGEIVGVGANTISKWENDVCMPSISNIASLAKALHISTDELLCFNDRRNELELLWQETLRTYGDDPQKLLEVSVTALKGYPTDKTFLFRASISEERLADAAVDKISKYEHLHNAMSYTQRLLNVDPEFESAKYSAVSIYSKLGMNDLAIEQAYKCKNIDLAMKFCLKGDDLRRHRQKLINIKLHDLLVEMSIKEAPMIDASEKILNAIFPNGNYQNYFGFISGIYLKRASMLVESGDKEAAIDTLKELLEIARKTDDFESKQLCFNTPIFDLLEVHKPPIELSNVDMTLMDIKREFGELSDSFTT